MQNKKKYLSPEVSVLEIFIENTIANSSISEIKVTNDGNAIVDEWLQENDDEKIFNWY